MEFPSELQTPETWSKGARLQLTGLVSIFLFLFSSCDDGQKVLPAFSGRQAEVVVVMKENHWEGRPGEVVREAFYHQFPSLPQIEPSFSLVHRTPDNLSYNLRIHRNILFADIEDNERNIEPRGIKKQDRWSQGQIVYTFHALDGEAFVKKFNELSDTVIKDIQAEDRKREQRYLTKIEHPTISKKLNEKMGLDLLVHREFKLHEISDDFAWMTRERIQYLSGVGHDVIQGIAIYTRPYTSDSLFNYENLIANRNASLEDHILSSYDEPMRVETIVPPDYVQVDFKGQYAVEGRGLWRMERPIMGGPFVSLSVVDEKNSRIITVDGYVFAPKFDKRDYLLDVEAIVYSLTY